MRISRILLTLIITSLCGCTTVYDYSENSTVIIDSRVSNVPIRNPYNPYGVK